MTTLTDREGTALLVVDVQNGVVDGTHRRDAVVSTIATLVDRARAADVPVVWVQDHGHGLAQGSPEGEHVPDLQRVEGGRSCTSGTATPSRTPTSRRCSPPSAAGTWW